MYIISNIIYILAAFLYSLCLAKACVLLVGHCSFQTTALLAEGWDIYVVQQEW